MMAAERIARHAPRTRLTPDAAISADPPYECGCSRTERLQRMMYYAWVNKTLYLITILLLKDSIDKCALVC
jgi:hypothetical protein